MKRQDQQHNIRKSHQVFGNDASVDEPTESFDDGIADDVDSSVAVVAVKLQEKSLGVGQVFAETLSAVHHLLTFGTSVCKNELNNLNMSKRPSN